MAFQGLRTYSKSGLICAITIHLLQEGKRRVPKVNQGQLHHNYSKIQSLGTLFLSPGAGNLKRYR